MKSQPNPDFLSVDGAARLVGLTHWTIRRWVRFGKSDGGGDVHVHHHAVYNVQAFNSSGVEQVLRDPGDKFVKHAENHPEKAEPLKPPKFLNALKARIYRELDVLST
jgi:hypothetical protein